MSKPNNMKDNKIQLTDAHVECITGIQEFIEDFHSVADLYQRLANALTELMLVEIHMPNEARKKVNDMAQDYLALLNLLDPINPLTHPVKKG